MRRARARREDHRPGERPFARLAPWLLPALAACQTGTPAAPSASSAASLELLGWEAPPEARVVRRWPREVVESAPRWTLAQPPIGVVVPDSADTWDGQLVQRQVPAATVLPSGNIVLLLAGGSGDTRVIVAEPDLRRVKDADDPDQVRHDRIPPGHPGGGHYWREGGRVYLSGQHAVVGGFAFNPGDRIVRGGPFETLRLDSDGRITGSPTRISGIDGSWRGVFPDGSLFFTGRLANVPGTDSVVAFPFLIARANASPQNVGGRISHEVLFTAGALRDPARPRTKRVWSHDAGHTVAVSGETIWVAPSERPELVALLPSGEILLMVEWDAGDRTVPSGLPDWQGIERFPAVAALFTGSDGRIYVQRWSLQRGYPVRGPEWLVFDPDGNLLARVHIPRNLRVLAFGAGTVLVKGTTDSGVDEVRLHALEEG